MKHVNNKGFSLIELMIVVAIIGILATVAIPNFQKFQGKAKQSEAKSQLGGYYMAQKAFFAEYNFYTGTFGMAGFVPQGQINYRIDAANGSAGGTTNLPGPMVTADAACISTHGAVCTPAAYGGSVIAWTETVTASGCTPTAAAAPAIGVNSFTGAAAAKFQNAPANDEWTINDGNLLSNVTYGI